MVVHFGREDHRREVVPSSMVKYLLLQLRLVFVCLLQGLEYAFLEYAFWARALLLPAAPGLLLSSSVSGGVNQVVC